MNIDITSMTLSEVAARCHRTAVEHGFSESPVNIDQKLLLAVGELVEAQNEIRAGHAPHVVYANDKGAHQAWGDVPAANTLLGKPEGFLIELADAVIRICDLAEDLGLDLQAAVQLKMNYNEGRPFKHGKLF